MNKKHTRVDEMIAPTLEGLTDRVSPVDGLPIAEVMVELGVVRDRQAAMTDTRLQRSVGQGVAACWLGEGATAGGGEAQLALEIPAFGNLLHLRSGKSA